ncbi:HEAT repeat domain-containing protein [Aquimarina sp. MMG015]|uniref:HEAT repeat domain-containing protein n=1 Tax=Aquimarina sp. MMG015 TaxID=2822689 RepID=UPI001B3A47A4|nr:zf-HC2 domain-containing protein [Aquimarina sp. MMG015]MBQ4801661.1 HEAT repeat domain-containing protein [Aquimarina sp. MMG015]
MNCKQIEEKFIDYLDDNLDQQERETITAHLTNCNSCKESLNELRLILNGIDNTDQELPNKTLKEGFEKMLEQEKKLLSESKVISLHNSSKKYWKTALQIAATIALIISSYFYGKQQNNASFYKEMAVLEKEKIQLKQEVTISLIENESASKRLQAVNYAEEFEKPGNDILEALISKMFYDDHINVRLAAAEALAKFSDLEMVRKSFINALETEQDPGMQIELIQILVSIQEKRAVPSMEKLLQNEETPSYVKDQVNIGLPNLI